MTVTPDPAEFCSLWRRLPALVYDLLMVLALVIATILLCLALTGGPLFDANHQSPWWYKPLQGVMVAGYFLISWLRGGQTLGMRPWRIRLTTGDNQPLRLPRALWRLGVAAAPMLLLMLQPWLGVGGVLGAVAAAWAIWFGVAAFDPRHRALHDILARTQLRRMD